MTDTNIQPIDTAENRCTECVFVYFDPHLRTYQCRANPPSPFPMPAPPDLMGRVNVQVISMYPPVAEDSFCGCFEAMNAASIEH